MGAAFERSPAPLGQDNQVKGMLAAPVGVMEDNELLDQAARYRAIVDLESDR
jgi:hypothetical protein